jgi:hypothetical protein
MNFIFKIVGNHPETEQLVVKYCHQNSSVSIDNYRAHAVDYDHLDFSTYETFIMSLMRCGRSIVMKQLGKEVGNKSNYDVEFTNSTEIEDNLNKIVSLPYEEVMYFNILPSYNLNKIDLEL